MFKLITLNYEICHPHLGIIITIDASFLVSHFYECLLNDGHKILVLENFFTGIKDDITYHFDRPHFVLNQEYLPVFDPKQRQLDIMLAKKKLGWKPKVTLEVGLKPTIAYFEELLNGVKV